LGYPSFVVDFDLVMAVVEEANVVRERIEEGVS